MSKVRVLAIAVVALILLNVALVAFFVSRGPLHFGPPPRPEGPKRIIIGRLHFDAGQIDAYEQAIAEHQEQIEEKAPEQKRLRNALYALLQGQNRSGADSIASAIGALQTQIELTHFKHFQAIEAICRPDQKADFIALSHELARLFRGPPPRPERP